MVNELLKHDNAESDGSKYAADFDYIMHQFCVENSQASSSVVM